MMLKPGAMRELSCPQAAFRAWVLTTIMPYTDWIQDEARKERDAEWSAAAREYLLNDGSMGNFDAAALVKARDALNALIEEVK